MSQICVIGSGNWGTTVGKLLAENVPNNKNFNSKVTIWVFEENINGKKLSEIVNLEHNNPKYLPGIKLPTNLVADPDLSNVTQMADLLFFALPHEHLPSIIHKMANFTKPTAKAVSLMKGIIVTGGKGLLLLSDMIANNLNIPCAVVMGANRAGEVAGEIFGEATVGSKDLEFGKLIKQLIQTDYLKLVVTQDQVAVELCGALKNIVAIATGIISGLGHGDNTKAAFIRLGYWEILAFMEQFYKNRKVNRMTVFQSCGFAEMFMCLAHNKDLMSTPIDRCYGSRNILAGMTLSKTNKTLKEIEKDILKGTSAEGAHTAAEVYEMLVSVGQQDHYPIISTVHKICMRQVPATTLIVVAQNHPAHF